MSAKNDHTGDSLISRPNSKTFGDNFDRIFRKKSAEEINEDVSRFNHHTHYDVLNAQIGRAKSLLELHGYRVEKIEIYQD